jgi:prepilin-type N-terminal cleavage/methylation domain-containing protein
MNRVESTGNQRATCSAFAGTLKSTNSNRRSLVLMKDRDQKGFTLLEISIVLAIMLVMTAMAAPLITNAVNVYRLRGGGTDYANLLQTARMMAVRDDLYHSVTNTNTPPTGTNFNTWVDINSSTTYVAPDPALVLPTSIQFKAASSAPSVSNLRSLYLPSTCGSNAGCVTVNPNKWGTLAGPTFGARGLPCQATSQTNGSCSYASTAGTAGDNGSAGGLPVAFEIYLQNQRTSGWEAVTVSPAARIRLWNYDPVSQTWSPLD